MDHRAPIPADDRGLLLGDGLFETVLFRAGAPALWDAHLDRLARGCLALGLPQPDRARLRVEADRAVDRAGLADERAAVRLTWTAGSGGRGLARPRPMVPRLIVTAAPSPAPTEPARLVTARVRRNAGSPASRLKTLSYIDNVLARLQAEAAGADEAVMLNTDGDLACATAANLFWITGDRLLTPALACGVLDGIMRGAALAAARRLSVDVAEVSVAPDALAQADALFLTSSLAGLRPIASLDARPFGPHRLIGALQQALADVT